MVCEQLWKEVTLSSTADLNTLFDANTWWVSLSGSSSATISNTPWTGGGFVVYNEAITAKTSIKSGSGGLFHQCLIPNNSESTLMYRRRYTLGQWEDWYVFTGSKVIS